FAANPFSDVTPSDWAYQSVSQLAAAGVINGYPDGTFQGQKNITRYEMAQMVAKAMANEARANAEQQAMINRLADEFSSELN
ncbi:S-layer homology domain-containing protein, partial [Veillonella magna]